MYCNKSEKNIYFIKIIIWLFDTSERNYNYLRKAEKREKENQVDLL